MCQAEEVRLSGHAERIPRPTLLTARGKAHEMLAVADRGQEKFLAAIAPRRVEKRRDHAGATID